MLNFIVLALLNWFIAATAARSGDAAHAGDPRRAHCRGWRHVRAVPRLGGESLDRRGSRRRGSGLVLPLSYAPRLRAPRGRAAARRRGVRRDARVGRRLAARAHAVGRRSPESAGSTTCSATSTTTRTASPAAPGFLGIAVALVGRNHPVRRGAGRALLRHALAGRARDPRFRPEADGGRAAGRRDPRRRGVGARGAARFCAAHEEGATHESDRLPDADDPHRDSVPLRGERRSGRRARGDREPDPRGVHAERRFRRRRSGANYTGSAVGRRAHRHSRRAGVRAASTPLRRSVIAPTRSSSASRSICWRSGSRDSCSSCSSTARRTRRASRASAATSDMAGRSTIRCCGSG